MVAFNDIGMHCVFGTNVQRVAGNLMFVEPCVIVITEK